MPATSSPPRLTLDEDQLRLGLFAKIPDPVVAKIVALSSPEFVIIDQEHSPLGPQEVFAMTLHYQAAGVPAIVRINGHDVAEAQRVLDMGVAGIMFPHVEDADQAEAIFTPLVFPPAGTRGSGYGSAAGSWGGLPGGREQYRQDARAVLRIAMVEDPAAVAVLGEIAGVTGVDAIFVGPGDLGMSIGVASNSREVATLQEQAFKAAAGVPVPVGTTTAAHPIPDLARFGCRFATVGSDTGLLRRASAVQLADARALVMDEPSGRHGSPDLEETK